METSLGTIGVTASGNGGIPLLFLHGVGSNRSSWDRQIARFGEERMTIALDWPGYGDSDFIPDATGDTFAEAAMVTLAALGIARVHVCGLSLGGVIALRMAARAPEAIASLIIANSFAWHPDGAAIHSRSVAAAGEVGMAALAELRADSLLAQPCDPALRAEVIETMARIDPEAYRLAAAAVWLADVRKEAAGWRGPALIVTGSEDRITPPSLADALKDLMPHATLVEIAGAGHLSNLEKPAIFDRVLRAFLVGVEEQSRREEA